MYVERNKKPGKPRKKTRFTPTGNPNPRDLFCNEVQLKNDMLNGKKTTKVTSMSWRVKKTSTKNQTALKQNFYLFFKSFRIF